MLKQTLKTISLDMQKNNTAEFLRKHILCFFFTMLCFALYFPGVYPLSLILCACSTNILSTEVGSSRYEWIPAWPQKKKTKFHMFHPEKCWFLRKMILSYLGAFQVTVLLGPVVKLQDGKHVTYPPKV